MSLRVNQELLQLVDTDLAGRDILAYQGTPFTGIAEFYNDDGVLEGEVEYRNGFEEGVQRDYFANGQMKYEFHIYRSNLVKDFKEWDESGNLISHIVYNMEGDHIGTIV